jgi:hypothetical protein
MGLSTQPWHLMVLMAVLGACAASSWIALVPVVGGSAAEDGDGRRLPGSAGREALAGV